MIRPVTLFASILFLFSCGNKTNVPGGILKKEKMETVLWDVFQADAFAFQFVTKDSSKVPEAEMAKIQLEIFSKHNTTREEFYKSFSYYKNHPDILQPMLDSMITKYTRDKYIYTKGDTANKIQPKVGQ